jgi:hypothetical protein
MHVGLLRLVLVFELPLAAPSGAGERLDKVNYDAARGQIVKAEGRRRKARG